MKLLFVFAMLLIASGVSAQRIGAVFIPLSKKVNNYSSVRDVIDTLTPPSFVPVNEGGLGCFTGYFNSPDSGYVSGNNQYGDLEKAQFFSLTQMGHGKGGTVLGVLVHFAYKTIGAQTENVVVKIYDVDTNGFHPLNLLGTSDPADIGSITTDGTSTYFSFTQPIAITDSFFVSVQLPSLAGDTVVILSTDDDCVSTSGWSWELWDNGTWHQMLYSWVLDFDLTIFPIVDLLNEVGINEINAEENSLNISLYPNPVSDVLNLSLLNSPPEKISIDVIDPLGRVLVSETDLLIESTNSFTIPFSKFENGIYTLRIHSGNLNTSRNIVVQH